MTSGGVTNGLVLFGGDSISGFPTADTWTWNGTDWTQQSPAHSPSARRGAAATFDPVMGQPLLFGGIDAVSSYLADTWTWTGADWSLQTPAHSPPARGFAAMVFNTAAHRAMLFGGGGGAGWLPDTWVWHR